MNFEVLILGCGAATPTNRHNPSSQVVTLHDKLFMIDCGEGTQMQLRKYKVRFQKIDHIFISHLHGDHYLGLMGLISSMHLLGRKSDLHIYGPEPLKELIDINLKYSETYLDFMIHHHPVNPKSTEQIHEDKTLTVHSFPLRHRVPCNGFLFREKKRQYKVIKEKISEYRLAPSQILLLKKGESITLTSGYKLTVDEACISPENPRAYAYCSDTSYYEKLVDSVKGVDLLYHESTFLESESDRAKTTFHSTAKQAAKIAQLAGAKKLLLGHYSSRYMDDFDFQKEASEVFSDVQLASEGERFIIETIK